jgi:hypothetical protein
MAGLTKDLAIMFQNQSRALAHHVFPHCCRLVNDEYKIWKKNTPFLYGMWQHLLYDLVRKVMSEYQN